MADLTQGYRHSAFPEESRLLPWNSTKLERDMVKVGQFITDLPTDELKTFFDPDKCPSEFLGWLAAHETVDLWYDDWPDTTKRSIIKNIVSLKRRKGTLSGIEAYLSYVNATVVKVVRPPARGFMRNTMTDTEKLTWLSSLPQIRFYPYITRRIAPPFTSFYRQSPEQSGRVFHYNTPGTVNRRRSFMRNSYGPQLYGVKAYFVDPLGGNVLVPVKYSALTDPLNAQLIETVNIGFPSAPHRTFYGRSFYGPKSFMRLSRAASNVVNVILDPNAPSQYATFSGDQTTNVKPVRVFASRVAQARSFSNNGLTIRTYWGKGKNRFLRESYAPFMIYDQVSIYDASRLTIKSRARSYYGHFQYGIDPYTVNLTVSIPMNRPKPIRGLFYGKGSFRRGPNLEPLYRALDAVHIARSERDKILIQPQTHEVVRLSSKLHLGNFRLGQIVSTI